MWKVCEFYRNRHVQSYMNQMWGEGGGGGGEAVKEKIEILKKKKF